MNVLVTGASSPIGEQVVLRLLKDSRVAHIVAVADNGKPISVPENRRVTNTSINFKSQRQLHTLLFGLALEKMFMSLSTHLKQNLPDVKEVLFMRTM